MGNGVELLTRLVVGTVLGEHRVHVAFQARLPKGASEDIIIAIEAQPGVRHIRVDVLE